MQVRANVGNAVVCVALRDIRAGEEVTENYGVHHTEMSAAARNRILLNNYGFECRSTSDNQSSPHHISHFLNQSSRPPARRCDACAEDWPLKGALPSGSGESEAKAFEAAALIKKADGVDGWAAAAEAMIETSPESRRRPTRGNYELQSAVWDHLWNGVGNKVVKRRP